MRNPTVRSASSSSSASTSSISASESASRSSTNDWPSVIVDGSISRMSARLSRTISKIASRSIGPCSTWVSAGTVSSLLPAARWGSERSEAIVAQWVGGTGGGQDRRRPRTDLVDDPASTISRATLMPFTIARSLDEP